MLSGEKYRAVRNSERKCYGKIEDGGGLPVQNGINVVIGGARL
jgi:hypothetical protein